MDFYGRDIGAADSVTDGDACVAVGGGVDDEAVDGKLGPFVNGVDNKAFVVGLEEEEACVELGGFGFEEGLEVMEALGAV